MDRSWRPSATREMLALRADVYRRVREFMQLRGVLEVETPILDETGNPDPNIHSISAVVRLPHTPAPRTLYLQTSPEFAMKRLLAAGYGPIYQISRVFRDAELGRMHQPEFTMLEWYRPGFDHLRLMDEMEELLELLGLGGCRRQEYGALFHGRYGVDPHTAEIEVLMRLAAEAGLQGAVADRSLLLEFLFSHGISEGLGLDGPEFVLDFPACQAALARLSGTTPQVAQRFELFVAGMELANGFNELCDNMEQRRRFERDNQRRSASGMEAMPPDERLLAALEHGMPECAGVALGMDRLLMAITDRLNIGEVLAFPAR